MPTLAKIAATALLVFVASETSALALDPDDRALPDVSRSGTGTGTWDISARGVDRFHVRWTSERRLPVGSDRPVIASSDGDSEALDIGLTVLSGDGRTVSALVTAASAPDPADLDVLLSGVALDEIAPSPQPGDLRASSSVKRPSTTPLTAPDPGLPGPHAVVSSDYRLPGIKLPRMVKKVEMIGHVVEPAASTGPSPLVVFMHGRHETCYGAGKPLAWPCRGKARDVPSHLGYTYMQKLLASQGYTTVSVRANGINAQDYKLLDGGADARAKLIAAHLDRFASGSIGSSGTSRPRQVDYKRVVVVGHSRGGEGANRAALQVPLSAPYRIVGQVLIGPTDFAAHTAPYIPTVSLLPYCDGDVFESDGQRFIDTARDLVDDDTALRSSVMVMGANHNFFNTEWTPRTSVAPSNDDWWTDEGTRDKDRCGRRAPGRLSPGEQRAVGRAYVAAAVKVFLGEDRYLPLFDGSPASVASARDADVRSHAIGGGRDLRRPGIEATLTETSGSGRSRMCLGVMSYEDKENTCGQRMPNLVTPHWYPPYLRPPIRQFFEMTWNRAGAGAGLRFERPLDLTSNRLELRTIVDPLVGKVDLRVRIRDGSGASAVLTPVGGSRVGSLPRVPLATKLWAQAVLVDATGATGLNRADIRSVELLGDSPRGRVWVADLAAAPATLAPVPNARLPLINVGNLNIDEGDPGRGADKRRRVARVPFRISGEVTRPSQFVVKSVARLGGKPPLARSRIIDVAPGQTRGTILVRYTADRVPSPDVRFHVRAWPLRWLATDAYIGVLTVRNDDGPVQR